MWIRVKISSITNLFKDQLTQSVIYTLAPKCGLEMLLGLDEITRSCLDKNLGKLKLESSHDYSASDGVAFD